MGYAEKTNPFAPLIWINGEEFIYKDPYGNRFDNIYYDPQIEETHHFFTVNNPAIGYTEQSEQLVQSTRNALGEVVAEKINRRINKFDNLYWPYLSRVNVHELKQYIKDFNCKISYWDDEEERWITRDFYWGDFSATPCEWEIHRLENQRDSIGRPIYIKRPIWYKDVKCNLIDKGLNP